MKITSLSIKNFRSLQDITMELEDSATLVIGKNNTGKTSMFVLLDIFLNNKNFSVEDLNLYYLADKTRELSTLAENTLSEFELQFSLELIIEYSDRDNLNQLSYILPSLSETNNQIHIKCEYTLIDSKKKEFYHHYQQFIDNNKDDNLFIFLKELGLTNYFIKQYYSIDTEHSYKQIIELKQLTDVISLEFIHASREVNSSDNIKNINPLTKLLDSLKGNLDQTTTEDYQNKINRILQDLNSEMNNQYGKSLETVTEDLRTFTNLNTQAISEINEQHISNYTNTRFIYATDQGTLPEHYNGLGYLNFIHMILNIHTSSNKLKNSGTPINLLIIEEPEAHSHPQMQYTFIKNITDTIKKIDVPIQTLISTHSAHIISQSDFSSIRYLQKQDNSVLLKNIKELKNSMKNDFHFLHKYLTTQNTELFFTDKAIFVEGTTERILLPAMMKKITPLQNNAPLYSQYISIIEMGGAHAHIFNQFLDFIGVKTLIITDIDSCKDNKKCCVAEGIRSSNSGLNYFFKNQETPSSLQELTSKTGEQKTFQFQNGIWQPNKDGNLRITYQIKENDYHARSFEDAFIHCNRDFITNNEDLKNHFSQNNRENITEENAYILAERLRSTKAEFAADILYCSLEDYSNWNIPQYIKEGLEWLQQ
ncbi:MAG: ATP-dependent nuclease [Brevinema sp.]